MIDKKIHDKNLQFLENYLLKNKLDFIYYKGRYFILKKNHLKKLFTKR